MPYHLRAAFSPTRLGVYLSNCHRSGAALQDMRPVILRAVEGYSSK